MIVRNKWLTVLGLTGLLLSHFYRVEAQQKTASPEVYVDDKGVMRWGSTRKEVQGFGVNYTVPFAHAYRTAQRLNVDLEKAIDDDVYHFARLGFDTYRVHVYDSEVSDTLGNLLDNAHLKTFDYALKKMKERGMKFILTPIAYWGNGWPEPDEKTPGFSSKYGKDASLTNPDAIKAQEMYLFQFLNHVNPYTGVAYKDDPDIIAFEVSNEPHHGEAPAQVTAFINRMVQSMRKTGCRKPIFYNISHKVHLADAYFDADIQGGTFQWYPTGLGAGRELGGNLLPNVDAYTIPFANNPRFRKSAKIVYEFDAADVGRSYIYPAMARSFRTAGIQVATHFAYDPTYMAYANTEFGTHYMNLAYAPQKALSLKIASEVFHTVPMYKDYGSYPRNASFDGFQVSYEKDLAEMVTEKKFIYTNHTTHAPTSAAKLEQVAGWGNSPLVNYAGTGAYFLNKLENGVWRLEVMPDAVWVRDPFEKASLKKSGCRNQLAQMAHPHPIARSGRRVQRGAAQRWEHDTGRTSQRSDVYRIAGHLFAGKKGDAYTTKRNGSLAEPDHKRVCGPGYYAENNLCPAPTPGGACCRTATDHFGDGGYRRSTRSRRTARNRTGLPHGNLSNAVPPRLPVRGCHTRRPDPRRNTHLYHFRSGKRSVPYLSR